MGPVFFSIFIFFAVISLCFLVYFMYTKAKSRKEQTQRISQVVNFSGPTGIIQEANKTQAANVKIENGEKDKNGEKQQGSGGIRRDSRISNIHVLNLILSKISSERVGSLKILIEQTGLKVKTGEFLLFVLCLSTIGMLGVYLFLKIPVIGAAVGIFPFIALNVLKQKRLDAFVQQLPEALEMLGGDLRAGLDVQAAIKHISDEFSAPAGEEFAKVNVEIGLGLPISEALTNLVRRMNTMDVQILCTGIIINREMGGNLGELVRSVAETIKERFKLKGMIRTLIAENQASAYLLLALPVGLFFLLSGMAPETYKSFLSDPVGRGIMYGCVGSMTIGFLIIKKVTTLEV